MRRFESSSFPIDWCEILELFFQSSTGRSLQRRLADVLQAGGIVYPSDPFYALRCVAPESVKVVVLGQDPYHGPGQAMGLAFSVPPTLAKIPPSLRNIDRELCAEYGAFSPADGDLTDWARQGVLLLNAVLTVEPGRPACHAAWGWQELTDAILLRVLQAPSPKVFLLWGAHAQAKMPLIGRHATGPVSVLMANHPSPLSATRPPVPFIGCGHFRKANEFLERHGVEPIDWVRRATSSEFELH